MYVRFVKASVWARLLDDGEDAIAGAIAELRRSGQMVSVYEVATRDELELVAIALIANLRRQHFWFIEIEPPTSEVSRSSNLAARLRFLAPIDCTGISI